jgi:hypothetical protein
MCCWILFRMTVRNGANALLHQLQTITLKKLWKLDPGGICRWEMELLFLAQNDLVWWFASSGVFLLTSSSTISFGCITFYYYVFSSSKKNASIKDVSNIWRCLSSFFFFRGVFFIFRKYFTTHIICVQQCELLRRYMESFFLSDSRKVKISGVSERNIH